jgi:hypothetical protein
MCSNFLKYINVVNLKFDEYFFFLINRKLGKSGFQFSYENTGSDIPFVKFNIYNLVSELSNTGKYDDQSIERIGKKLIDIKMLYCFLRTTMDYFYLGTTLIVGNDEVEKLNPATISLLRNSHYRVYLVSALTESILDCMQLIFLGEIKDHRKNKWYNILYQLKSHDVEEILSLSEQQKLLDFKNNYRTAELHKFSKVRSFISKDKWDHFQEEEEILTNALSRLYSKLVLPAT